MIATAKTVDAQFRPLTLARPRLLGLRRVAGRMAGAGSVVLVCRAPQVASGSIQREPRGEPRVVQLPRFRRLRSSATSSGTSRSLSLRDGTGSERRRPTRRDAAQESCRGRFPRSGQDASDATAQIHGLARFLSSSALQVMPCGAPVPACRADHGPPNETYRFFSCIYVWIAAKSATGGTALRQEVPDGYLAPMGGYPARRCKHVCRPRRGVWQRGFCRPATSTC